MIGILLIVIPILLLVEARFQHESNGTTVEQLNNEVATAIAMYTESV